MTKQPPKQYKLSSLFYVLLLLWLLWLCASTAWDIMMQEPAPEPVTVKPLTEYQQQDWNMFCEGHTAAGSMPWRNEICLGLDANWFNH